MTELPPDFKEFLKLLSDHHVEYLLIGGYAVMHYGYVRATADMDIWIAIDADNAGRILDVLTEFGFGSVLPDPAKLMRADQIVRLGVPPNRLEIMTTIDGVDFESCFENRQTVEVEGVQVNLLGLADLRKNKMASGRLKDLADLDNLPEE